MWGRLNGRPHTTPLQESQQPNGGVFVGAQHATPTRRKAEDGM